MDPKFLVIEIDSKEQAIQLVQVMLDKGFARLMLLDDLSKHPTLVRNQNECRDNACSPFIFGEEEQSFPIEEKYLYPNICQESSSMVSSNGIKQEAPPVLIIEDDEAGEEEEEEELLLTSTSRRPTKRRYNHQEEDQEYREQLMHMLNAEPEIVPIGVNSMNDESSRSEQSGKKSKNGDYHECRLCGVRVKTPRSGRWNLQMHVIALHCVGRQYRCKKCDYLDYRKSTMRKHTVTQHGSDIPPHNITNDIMKREWHEAMIKCFPEFAHRTGFLS
uniref:C2H2-type domain-containing protein n=1 Tax=Caenorhabditis tropicalis TaxID=1561998 RepID=A0A1I7U9T9_9PELO